MTESSKEELLLDRDTACIICTSICIASVHVTYYIHNMKELGESMQCKEKQQ